MAIDSVEPRTPPAGQSCATCAYFNQFGKSQCRRSAPVVLFAGNTAKYPTDYRSVWPVVAATDWCGDWKTV